MKKRWYKKREAELKGTGYDSLFEKNMHETVLKDCLFHPKDFTVSYFTKHLYHPDFVHFSGDKTYLLETKGRFRDNTEAAKYRWVRDCLPENTEIIFIWDKALTKFPFAKKRKDGTYMTHEEWANKEGFRNWDQTVFTTELLNLPDSE